MRNFARLIPFLLLATITALVVSCRDEPAATEAIAQVATLTATYTPTVVPSATNTATSTTTPTPTNTPTPTPTPTPTALPVQISGDPRAAALRTPEAMDGAQCGLVDTLDYPLNPPDARNVGGGQDFGTYRERYGSYHTGEDWWFSRGTSNFGQPVYSIGHGRITYAHPNGWGRDQGVLIVRHTFTDGRTILSFYGHLDPPSVLLNAGDCVARGDKVGEIGRPRTPPHLHFEMRSHMPNEPGPGYWGEDFLQAGWVHPSLFIWNERVATAPGVLWHERPEPGYPRPLGPLGNDGYVTLAGGELLRFDTLTGSSERSGEALGDIDDAVMDVGGQAVYVADRFGRVTALLPAEVNSDATNVEDAAYQSLWEVELDVVGTPKLMPMPGGGAALFARGTLFALSEDGELLWEKAINGRIFDWAISEEWLLFSTSGSEEGLWVASQSGVMASDVEGLSRPVFSGDEVFVYGENGVHRLEPETGATELFYRLPTAFLRNGDIVALPDGGVLLAHRDLFDRRLIALNGDGSLRWERSLVSLENADQQLLVVGGMVYLFSTLNSAAGSWVTLSAIDLDEPGLTRIFDMPLRSSIVGSGWVAGSDPGRILMNIGGSLIMLGPAEALAGVSQSNAP